MADKSQSAVAEPQEDTIRRSDTAHQKKSRARPKRQPPYNVILWDDQDHTHAYVVLMMRQLFNHPPTKGFQIADEVDRHGRAVVMTTTLEHAELKRDQIRAFGKDTLNAECGGSMYSSIEPLR